MKIMPIECRDCERLVSLRKENKKKYPKYYNKAVPGIGPRDAKLLILGLAPGLHGANASGIPFNGDFAGRFLNHFLVENRFTVLEKSEMPFNSVSCYITNVVKCLPPSNRPLQSEITRCSKYLKMEISFLNPNIILCLGVTAHKTLIRLKDKTKTVNFKHGNRFELGNRLVFDSYHPSKINVLTGRLTKKMFDDILKEIRKEFECSFPKVIEL